MDGSRLQDALTLIRMGYREMPGLKLTACQARRLFDLPAEPCEAALEALVQAGFLGRSRDGAFVRRSDGVRDAA